jgi:hypothetical protein
MPARQIEEAREDSQHMYDGNTVRGRRGARRNRRRNHIAAWLAALAVTVSVIVVGYGLTRPAASHMATSADVQGVAGLHSGQGGWGRGGYTMMPGPAGGAGAAGNGPAESDTADEMSANWAGYAATGQDGSFTSVSASWSEPAVTCGDAETFSSFWVGLDGDGTSTVEQTGTEADCDNGTASYAGWYEIFPNAPVFFSNPVQPADSMNASVVSDGNGEFTLTLTDSTQGWTQTTQQSEPNAALGSAEIIAEAPSNGEEVLPLSDFGTADFTSTEFNNQPINSQPTLTAITMATNSTPLATPSPLTDNTTFTVTFDPPQSATPATAQGGSTGAQGSGAQGSGGQGGSDGAQGTGHHHHHHHGNSSNDTNSNTNAWDALTGTSS